MLALIAQRAPIPLPGCLPAQPFQQAPTHLPDRDCHFHVQRERILTLLFRFAFIACQASTPIPIQVAAQVVRSVPTLTLDPLLVSCAVLEPTQLLKKINALIALLGHILWLASVDAFLVHQELIHRSEQPTAQKLMQGLLQAIGSVTMNALQTIIRLRGIRVAKTVLLVPLRCLDRPHARIVLQVSMSKE